MVLQIRSKPGLECHVSWQKLECGARFFGFNIPEILIRQRQLELFYC